MLRLLVVFAAAWPTLIVPASAQPITRPALPGFCREWGGDRVVALACDPGREARRIDLRLGAQRARARHTLGVEQFAGAEPLQPGETVTLHWTHPSSRAVLAVWAASVQGPHMVVLGLRSRPESVQVTARGGGAQAAAAAARLQAQRAAATVDGGAPAPCAVGLRSDPAGDVVVQESEDRARDQQANAGVDLVGFGVAERCVALRTAGPLPASFEVQLGGDARDLRVTVTGGRVLVEDVSGDQLPKPVRGVAAHLDPDGIVLALPFALAAPTRITLEIERDQVSYGDDATTARATTRRCARPTC